MDKNISVQQANIVDIDDEPDEISGNLINLRLDRPIISPRSSGNNSNSENEPAEGDFSSNGLAQCQRVSEEAATPYLSFRTDKKSLKLNVIPSVPVQHSS